MTVLHIRVLTGLEFDVDVDLNSTIEALKQHNEDKIGVPPDQQRLIYAGKQLDDQALISHYGITEGTTVHLVMRIRGGSTFEEQAPVSVPTLGTIGIYATALGCAAGFVYNRRKALAAIAPRRGEPVAADRYDGRSRPAGDQDHV